MICRRSSCAYWMHSAEEQERYKPAIEAYEKYLEVLEECKNNESEEHEPA